MKPITILPFEIPNGTDERESFPNILYRKVNDIERPVTLHIGGSWNIYCDLPQHRVRTMIFEDLKFPYNVKLNNLPTQHGVILTPRVNLQMYTDTEQPQCVYFVPDDRPLMRFTFTATHIEIDDLNIVEVDVDTNFSMDVDFE